jgi:puromycin-sensitive aminopeptidase
MASAAEYRLSKSMHPEQYDITLAPDLEQFTFKGEETIELMVESNTPSITFNATELEIQHSQVTLENGKVILPHEMTSNPEFETITLSFEDELPKGKILLNIHFTGILNDQLRGFYRSSYVDSDGQTKYLASTQFEATDARRAFPCWDDPAVKAIYTVTLITPKGLTAISNTSIADEKELQDGTRAIQFKPSPRMSTYLVAFIVGDMACVEAQADNGTLMRVWTTKGKEEQGRFALENSVKLLRYYNEYFGIPYPLEKLDHIAIPDFAAGAMENWGAITYRETALLFDPENSSAASRQRILEVVSHEMAHMWFGDLVTMEWWDDLWLNESFASWMGDKAVDSVYPEWSMWTQFVSHDTNRALSLDGLRNSHPIEANVKNPAEIREMFDAISYSKGGSVLRMLEHFLGPDQFRNGLRQYLNRHQYANARTEDLWNALEEVSRQPVTALMDSWVKQTGYPLVTVATNRSSGNVEFQFQQERFLYDHLLGGDGTEEAFWKIPLNVAMGGGTTSPISKLMETAEDSLQVPIADSISDETLTWIKVNSEQTGFFRVNYPPEEWRILHGAITKKQIPAIDRLGLQNDAYALVRSGKAPASLFLNLAEAYQEESDASVLGDFSANLGGLEALISEQPYAGQFELFVRAIFAKLAEGLSWDPLPSDAHLDSIKRSIVLATAGSYGDPATLHEAKGRFDRYLKEPESLHPDLRGVVMGLVAQEGDAKTYEDLWQLYSKSNLSEEKVRLLIALSRFKNKELLTKTLARSMDPQYVRSQDTVIAVASVARNRFGRDLAWEFLKSNWDEFDRRYGQGGFAITSLVAITGAFTDLVKAQEVEDFFKAHSAPSAARTIQQSIERIRLNHAWIQLNDSGLAEWFSKQG